MLMDKSSWNSNLTCGYFGSNSSIGTMTSFSQSLRSSQCPTEPQLNPSSSRIRSQTSKESSLSAARHSNPQNDSAHNPDLLSPTTNSSPKPFASLLFPPMQKLYPRLQSIQA